MASSTSAASKDGGPVVACPRARRASSGSKGTLSAATSVYVSFVEREAMTDGGLVEDRGGRFASGSNSPALCAARSAVARPTQAFLRGCVASPELMMDSMYPLGFSGGRYLGALPDLLKDCANAARRASIAKVE